jgi:hypothetical protein
MTLFTMLENARRSTLRDISSSAFGMICSIDKNTRKHVRRVNLTAGPGLERELRFSITKHQGERHEGERNRRGTARAAKSVEHHNAAKLMPERQSDTPA